MTQRIGLKDVALPHMAFSGPRLSYMPPELRKKHTKRPVGRPRKRPLEEDKDDEANVITQKPKARRGGGTIGWSEDDKKENMVRSPRTSATSLLQNGNATWILAK